MCAAYFYNLMLVKAPKGKLRVLQLAAVIFLTISGGPYGLESILMHLGGAEALLLLLVTPLLWDIPAILTVMELNSMMPVAGGYYQWVKKAMGLKWAFFEGWWTWLYTFVDLAIYPVLFVTYAGFFFPGVDAWRLPVCLLIIWMGALLNIRGIVPVGKLSLLLGAVVLLPFIMLFIVALAYEPAGFQLPAFSSKPLPLASLGMGFYIIMWNFIGWDNATTYADEVDHPVRSYFKAVLLAFTIIIILYLLTMWTSIAAGVDAAALAEQGFPLLGTLLAGRWLGILLAVGGMAGSLGLFSAVLLSVSRIPKSMADDGLLPSRFQRTHPKFGTPHLSILICATVVSMLMVFSFSDLVVMDIIIYGAGLSLEYVSLIILRRKEPEAHRPYKIPLSVNGLYILFIFPVLIYVLALYGVLADSGEMYIPVATALGGLLSAVMAWQFVRKRLEQKKEAAE